MSFTYIRKGRQMYLESVFPVVPQKVFYEIISDRNNVISRMSDISPLDPDQTPGPDRYPQNVDNWFPVVDIQINAGMFAEVTVSDDYNQNIYFNSYMNREPIALKDHVGHIEGKWLTEWENGLYLLNKKSLVTHFAMYKEVPVLPTISMKLNTTITTISEDWGGRIRSWYLDDNGNRNLIGEIVIERPVKIEKEKDLLRKGTSTYREALNLCIGYILRSINHSPNSPHQDGLFLFYDLDADTYRNGTWPWSWGISIKLLLEASHSGPELIDYSTEELREAAWKIGNTSLKFQIINPDHVAHYFGTTRYTARFNEEIGYQELVNTGSDTGFLAGWGWIPLYQETGDDRFREAAYSYIGVLKKVLDDFLLPPQEWLPAQNNWTDFTVDESGFGTEGLNAYFQLDKSQTGFEFICRNYMEKHLAIFDRYDGLWERQYNFSTGKTDPTQYMTRGLGWAMEGLLATYRCTTNTRFSEKATKMAHVLISRQQPDGSWTFKFDQTVQMAGIADKGTSLWCLLLYMLYNETHEGFILDSARRALKWCMDNQYVGDNPHAYGGIISASGESGITYRNWFRLCCQYTSAFFGLALLEELKLGGQNVNNR
jgi:hypothetical protein